MWCLFCCVQGKFYLLIEELSQLFRALVPIQLWYKYIVGEDPSNSYFLGATLIIMYSICKVSSGKICNKGQNNVCLFPSSAYIVNTINLPT